MATVDVTRLAQALNLQPRRVQYLVKEGMPREARGKYDPVKCMCFYVRYLQGLIDKRSAPRDDQAGEGAERVRLLRAKADIRELQVARERSQLVPVADAQAFINELVDVTTTYVMAVPPRLAPELVGETSRIMVQAKIEKAFKAALSALAKYKPKRSASLS
jgi:phage terminase Nu1 subunit (DNA packaging protein)